MTDDSKISIDETSQRNKPFESWINKHNLVHLQETLVQHDLNSFNTCTSFATGANIVQKLKDNICNNDSDSQSQNEDLIKLEHAFNSLLKLPGTNHFRSKLRTLSRAQLQQNQSQGGSQEWSLMFVDCDDIESLLRENKITIDNVENSINLLQATIYRLIQHNSNANEAFGYHLGGDLFALFIKDNYSMNKSKEIVENLIKIMSSKDKSSLTISAGIGIRTYACVALDTKNQNHNQNQNKNKSDEEDEDADFQELQREWVLRAHINLLRAKENGKNCYFHDLVC